MIERIAVCLFCVFVGWILRGVFDTIRRARRAKREREVVLEEATTLLQQLSKECTRSFTSALTHLDEQLNEQASRVSRYEQKADEFQQERDRLVGKAKG